MDVQACPEADKCLLRAVLQHQKQDCCEGHRQVKGQGVQQALSSAVSRSPAVTVVLSTAHEYTHACDPQSAGFAAAVCRTALCQQMRVLSLNAACYADLTRMTCSLTASQIAHKQAVPGADVKHEMSRMHKRLSVVLKSVCY